MPIYKEHFEFSLSDPEKTDIQLVSVLDKRTGYIVRTALANNGKQTPSIMAFAGARFSRSSDTTEEIFAEIKASGKNAQEKLASIFRNYGHASVADMAQLFAYIENVPMIYEAKFFYETSVGGGQARSTRFQDFDNPNWVELKSFLPVDHNLSEKTYTNLNQQFVYLQQYSLMKYNAWVSHLTEKYTEAYEIDIADKKQLGALKARVFDSARYFLLSGLSNRTSLAWITSAREWARIISILKASSDKNLTYLAEQLEVLFAPDTEFANSIGYLPEAPDLIRYTAADETTGQNQIALKEFLEKIDFDKFAKFNTEFIYKDVGVKLYAENFSGSEKVVCQLLQTIYPNLDQDWALEWLQNLSEPEKIQLGQIVFSNFDHHKQMSNQYRVNLHSYVLTCSIAEARDLNRHRAWGRFMPILSNPTNPHLSLYDGFTLPLYLTNNPKLETEKVRFEKDILEYYRRLDEFFQSIQNMPQIPQTIVWELLPFAHVMKMWLHGSPKEISYMTKLRVRPGGHINYRMLAYLIAEKSSQADPFLRSLHLGHNIKPDPSSIAEFIDRG